MDSSALTVVGIAVGGGIVIGHFFTMHMARKAMARVFSRIAGESIAAVSVIATCYLDALVQYAGLTREDAAKRLLKEMRDAGVPVSHIQLRSGNVDKA